MKKNESLLSNNLVKDFRSNLRSVNIKDKIICFIPEWDDYNFLNIPRIIERKYLTFLLNQETIFQKIHLYLNDKNYLEFVAIQEISSEGDYFNKLNNEGLKSAVKDIESLCKKSDKKIKSGHLINKYTTTIDDINSLTKHIVEVFPNTAPYQHLINKPNTMKVKIKILYVDYEFFNGKLIYKFLDFAENCLQQKELNHDKLKNKQYQLFSELNPLLVSNFWVKASEIIDKLKNNSFNDKDFSEILFLSKNNLQNIRKPLFWNEVEVNGFIFNKIDNAEKTSADHQMVDVRFFYSFGHLLFFEFAKMIIGGRCRSCGKLLPKKYKGLYCPKSNKKCSLARNREKQRKHYTKLKNLTSS